LGEGAWRAANLLSVPAASEIPLFGIADAFRKSLPIPKGEFEKGTRMLHTRVKLFLATSSLMVTSSIGALVPYNGHFYDVLPVQTWSSAEAAAVLAGGHLVSINDAAEETFLRTTFGATTQFWIGFTDQASEGNFVWTSGDPVNYTNWNGGEPNNSGDEDYAVLNWNTANGAWNDWGGNNQIAAILEIAPVETGVPDAGSTALLLSGGLLAVAGGRRFWTSL
jgi:hypothetical protein